MPLFNQLSNVQNRYQRFNLVLCELHYTPIHGKTKQSCPTIEGHYLLIDKFDGSSGVMLDDLEEYAEYDTDHENISDSEDEDEEEEEDGITHIYQIQQLTRQYYMEGLETRQKPHKLIRNYHNIIRCANYIKPEIAECINLPTGEHIAIIKTMWIKLIQRKWKNVYAIRKHIIKCRSCPSSLSTRELTGYWPRHCRQMPSLKSMLSNI